MRRLFPLGLVAALLSTPALAEKASYNVSFAGVRAGILAFDASEQGGRYAVNGAVRPSGPLGVMLDGRIDSSASGRVSGNGYRPAKVREITTEPEKTTTRTIAYSAGGVPKFTRTPPRKKPQKHAAPASRQAGTVDTTTAAYAILRDRAADEACKLDLSIFDGAKRHRIQLNKPKQTRTGLRCDGTYSRVAGFSPKEMSERVNWPLSMDYTRLEDGTMRVTGITFPTSFGKARIRRR